MMHLISSWSIDSKFRTMLFEKKEESNKQKKNKKIGILTGVLMLSGFFSTITRAIQHPIIVKMHSNFILLALKGKNEMIKK